MKRFIVERNIAGFGKASIKEVRAAARASNAALANLAPDIQWVESFVAEDKTFCVYLAKDAETIREHGKLSGITVTKVTEIRRVIDPLSAGGR